MQSKMSDDEESRMPWPKEYFDMNLIALATKPHRDDDSLKIAKTQRVPANE
jgi:hypothetical protein